MARSLGARLATALAITLVVVLAGCGTSGKRSGGGGYYKDDGPDANPPSNLDSVPDAVPRIEPYSTGTSKPYAVFGKRYVPDVSGQPYRATGLASWYGKKFHGNTTANGERYDMYAMTAAHTTLPIPSYVRVTSKVNGRTVILRVNDRGPFHSDRIMDLSYVAAYKLGLIGPGSGEVTVEKITHDEIRRGVPASAPAPALEAFPIGATAGASQHNPASATLPQAAPQNDPIMGLANRPVPASSPAPSYEPRPLPALIGASAVGATGGAGVFLQLGAFSQSANAQALASKVQIELSGQVQASMDERGALYRVKVGPYPDRAAAVNAAHDIYQRIGIMPAIAAP